MSSGETMLVGGNLNYTLAEGVSIVGHGVVLSDAANENSVAEAFRKLTALTQATQWCVGDLVNMSEAKFGQKYAQLVDDTRLSRGTLMNYASMAAAFKPEERRNISFEHHRVVQKFSYQQRQQFLQHAIDHELSVPEFRRWVNEMTRSDSSKKKGDKSNDENEYVVTYKEAPFSRGDLHEALSDENAITIDREKLFEIGMRPPKYQGEILVIMVRESIEDLKENENQAQLDFERTDSTLDNVTEGEFEPVTQNESPEPPPEPEYKPPVEVPFG